MKIYFVESRKVMFMLSIFLHKINNYKINSIFNDYILINIIKVSIFILEFFKQNVTVANES